MSNEKSITITVASIPQREAGLEQVLASLGPQCDKLYVCLNDYAYVPRFVADNPKVEYVHLVDKDTISDHGKFLWNDRIHGYHLTVDDDILYPSDYVQHTLEQVEYYERRAVVGYHGTDLLLVSGRLLTRNKMSVKRLRFGDTLLADRQVYMLGTGVLAYHKQTMAFQYKQLRYGGTDEQLAMHCQLVDIPMVCLAHDEGWLVDNVEMSFLQNIGGNKDMDSIAMTRINEYERWHLPPLDRRRNNAGHLHPTGRPQLKR